MFLSEYLFRICIYVFVTIAMLVDAALAKWLSLLPEMPEYLDMCMPNGPNLWDAIIWCEWRFHL